MITKDDILKAKVLIVDDERVSNRLLTGILKKAGYKNITTISDSCQTLDHYLKLTPDALVLDLNMSKLSGFDVMDQLNATVNDNYLPIIIISNEECPHVRNKALEVGAKDFLHKPYEPIEIIRRIQNLIEVRLLHNEIRDQNKILEEKVRARTEELDMTQLDVVNRLARAIEYRDCETGSHTVRMSHYVQALARHLDCDDETCDIILKASPLHDIGKIGIPDVILQKPGKLTLQEWEIMKTHTTIGSELLAGSNSRMLRMAEVIALTHHEKWNGSGYPRGLKGVEIPYVGRICGLCDVFDALTTERPYKMAWSVEESIAEIKQQTGVHFDPQMVEALCQIIDEICSIRARYSDGF